MRRFWGSLLVAVALMAVSAGASVVTSIPGGTVVPIPAVPCGPPAFACFGPGPVTFGPGITWSSTNAFNQGGSVFGYTGDLGPYLYGTNGQWTGALGPMAGLNDSTFDSSFTDTMTFALPTPAFAVGGFLNYFPGHPPTTIAVYDSSCDPRVSTCTPIESYNLTFTTSGNDTGAFYGFRESSAVISYFTLTDNYVGITGFTELVPEPGSLLLIGTGLLGVIGYSRRHLGM
ncbi:MAG TPA: PEP-CTERM sorting domain-containing protein [Terriglobales bacterium]